MASRTLSAKLDDYWLGIRLQQVDIPSSHLLIEHWLGDIWIGDANFDTYLR